jgi:hypothetical protein
LFIHSLSGPSSCGGRLGPHRHRADNLSFYAIAHIFLETPGKQYCVWAYNASCTTGGMAGMPNLLGLHPSLMGMVAVLLSFGLSAALIAACVSLFRRLKPEAGKESYECSQFPTNERSHSEST